MKLREYLDGAVKVRWQDCEVHGRSPARTNEFDEVFARRVDVHIERMNDGHIWCSLSRGKRRVTFSLMTKRGAYIEGTEPEVDD